MKIINDSSSSNTFDTLKPGTTFTVANNPDVYMVILPLQIPLHNAFGTIKNAINLQSGESVSFHPHQTVHCVECELHVNGE